jgi:hypothetical protein
MYGRNPVTVSNSCYTELKTRHIADITSIWLAFWRHCTCSSIGRSQLLFLPCIYPAHDGTGHAGVEVLDLLPALLFFSLIFTPSNNILVSLTGRMVGLPLELKSQYWEDGRKIFHLSIPFTDVLKFYFLLSCTSLPWFAFVWSFCSQV